MRQEYSVTMKDGSSIAIEGPYEAIDCVGLKITFSKIFAPQYKDYKTVSVTTDVSGVTHTQLALAPGTAQALLELLTTYVRLAE